jgi:hydrogenase-4 component B
MSGPALTVLASVVGLLLALGVATAFSRAKVGFWGALLLCGAGSVVALAYLISGAEPAMLTLPFGLAGQSTILALDGVSGLFVLLLMLSGTAAAAASLDDHGHPPATAPAFPVFLGAMLLTLLAGDAFAVVAGFELMSLASFVLVVTSHREPGVRAAGVLYFGMAAIAGVCLIAALALLSAHGPSFAAIRAHPPEGWRAAVVLALVLLGPGSKAGLAPLHVWLPPAHSSAPGPVSALMSGAMTKIAVYVMIRLLFDLCGPAQPLWWGLPLLAMGLASAVLGAFRANVETDVKAVLACSTIENIGLVTIGLGIALAARAADLSALAGLALGAALLHVMAHGLFKTLLFLCAGAIQYGAGSRLMGRLGGLLQRMPITGCAMLLGGACLAGLPPSAGFASEWMLLQSVLGAVRLGGLGLQIVVCVLAAGLALAMALAGCAAVRLVGVALLGRPRSATAIAAVEAGPPVRWAMLGLALLIGLIGLFPGAVLGLAAPALRALADTNLAGRADALGISATAQAQGYVPLGVALLLAIAAVGIVLVLRARAILGHRGGPAWDCGFGAPPDWLPFGDPLTQYSAGGFSQPLRRILGPVLISATASVDMPRPGDTRPAMLREHSQDPASEYLFAPIAALRARLSGLADRMQFLTVRQILSVMVTALILFLIFIAVLEQL